MSIDARNAVVDVCARLRDEYPMIGGGLVDSHLPPDDPCWPLAKRALDLVADRSTDDLATELEAFAEVSIDFLRLQARFMRTGTYARAGDAASLVDELYHDASRMRGYYLDGLALTYALWPNHVRMIRFLSDQLLPRLRPGHRILEVGVGHGLLATLMFESQPDLEYVGVDISPSSLEYARAALEKAGIPGDRITMVEADATAPDLARQAGVDGFDALVCCEVLEHVDHPDVMLRSLATALGAGRPAFISTVANMEAEDHVFLYHDVDEIRSMLGDSGWVLVEDLPNVLPGAEEWDPLPVNYSALIESSPTG